MEIIKLEGKIVGGGKKYKMIISDYNMNIKKNNKERQI
jgi:hypothetical protein